MSNVLWHHRLGHASYISIKHLVKLSSPIDSPCNICPMAKQSRLSFHSAISTESVISDMSLVDHDNLHNNAQSDNDIDLEPVVEPTLRHSTRVRQPPQWLNYYYISNSISTFDSLPPCTPMHMSFLAKRSTIQEPHTYKQANVHDVWVQAMNSELKALEDNHTWDLVELPCDKKPIGCKWVYRVKYNPDGSVNKYNARLLLAIAAKRSWALYQLDINNAFLHGYLDEDIYIVPHEGYSKENPDQFYKLKRSLYDLKQASRQ
ncbi:transmembrane signal receptor [Lithospermum erythrorhizon]|uniref:Transmembrane signal receptor n=1 Tax=Lithospermum erythrorhizon TaxID=34254 RepID=A0AAV3Q8S9_LITER